MLVIDDPGYCNNPSAVRAWFDRNFSQRINAVENKIDAAAVAEKIMQFIRAPAPSGGAGLMLAAASSAAYRVDHLGEVP
jgi:hypothetical protein